jgi:dipeptidyl aminopeptidase/acylaminoacyl peptidase
MGTLPLACAALISLAVAGLVFAAEEVPSVPELEGQIVYTRQSDGVFHWDLYRSAATGDDEKALSFTEDTNAIGEEHPRWSPDGSEISFSTFSKNGDRAFIWRVPYSGGTPSPVATVDAPEAGFAAWQPNGDGFVFVGAHDGAGPSTLDIKLLTGDEAITLLETTDREERSPDISPDGESIVYSARALAGPDVDNYWDLRIMNADGSDDRLLVTRPFSTEHFPRFSPDGSKIAYVSVPGRNGFGSGSLWIHDIAQGTNTQLISTGVALSPAWSPDGNWLMAYNTKTEGMSLPGQPTPGPLEPGEQRFGLYAMRIEDRTLFRLRSTAGGADASEGSFKWGQVVDWTAGTYTPTPEVTDTPTPTASATSTLTPTASLTPAETDTPTATETAPLPDGIYLPITLSGDRIR